MSYEVLEKQIQTLPSQALVELSHYISYLQTVYSNEQKTETSISSKINKFLKNNPDCFQEFNQIEKSSLKAIRELTKDDTW